MPISHTIPDTFKGLSTCMVRHTPETSQAIALLHIAEAMKEKNKIESLRLKFEILEDQNNFTRSFRQKLINDITTELS